MGAGVAVAVVDGVGGSGGGSAATGEALAVFASSHCPGSPRSGEPMSSGGSAERVGGVEDAAAVPDGGGDGATVGGAGVVVLPWARR